ncbi:MAG: hypothetical protein HOD72_08270 [Opitutae bacterium]|jgi:hypothetical protein|nr:hypothetical protein [Opitutae bacterium]MBT4224441.1 hypothetical protein [Opitutae bacterium]MBT5380788.1 hypothetical protein [Opitutae bacterium]MBT5692557.1 hypothetical protein [Opitutae bacterium]MBT6463177.1 hypothetical protein [Opitutae bacterium]
MDKVRIGITGMGNMGQFHGNDLLEGKVGRGKNGQPIDVPSIDFGPAQLLLLPGESYVGYQLAA